MIQHYNMRLNNGFSVSAFTLILPLWELFVMPEASASSCSAQPLQIPITNNTIRDDIISYGTGAILGRQGFSLRVIDSDISSFFGIPPQCADDANPRGCAISPKGGNISEVLRGGFYDPKDSSTYHGPVSLSTLNITTVDELVYANTTYGTDTIMLGDTQIPSFPFKLSSENAETNWGELGLGPGSYALSALESVGRIPSQVWGFFGGWTGLTNETIQEGGVVLGGYDKSKVSGAFQEYSMTHDSRECYMRVTVTDIRVKLSNGLSNTIFSDGVTLDACISPSYELVTLPLTVVSNFAAEISGDLTVRTFGYFLYGYTVSSNVSDNFSLVFTLQNGQQIEILNHQLIQPNVQVTSTGYSIANLSTERTIRINGLQDINTNDNSQLGWPFLSAAYLLVDHQQDKFSIAPAVKTVVSTTSLVPVTRTSCTSAATISTTSFGGNGNTTSTPTNVPKQHSASKVIPIVVGIVCGIVVLVFLLALFWCLRKRRQTQPSPMTELDGSNGAYIHETDGKPAGAFQQKWGRSMPPMELPAERYSRNSPAQRHEVYEL